MKLCRNRAYGEEGLPAVSVVNCDNVISVPKTALATDPVGHLGVSKRATLDRVLGYALDIEH